ncbi:MAG: peptidoglycan editing factor PgeF [Eubacteriales bacterium]|nr:peptidoglycan editing factor PgeF [Eubacteriales bacterium]
MRDWIRKPEYPGAFGLQEHIEKNEDGSDLITLSFPLLDATGDVLCRFSTRDGGVSEGRFRSMNLSSNLGDEKERVLENYRRILRIFGADFSHIAATKQTHTTNVRIITEKDAGNGFERPYEYDNVDGIVTDVPGLVLAGFGSDCCLLFFADPVHRAVGVSHSGWKGTVGRIGEKTVRLMEKEYGTRPEDLLCAVGPSICRDCYEVSEDVAVKFQEEFPLHISEIMDAKGGGKYQLDLWAANRVVLEEAGVRSENIEVTDICTMCNPDRLFSHRATHGKRGNNGGFIMLKK